VGCDLGTVDVEGDLRDARAGGHPVDGHLRRVIGPVEVVEGGDVVAGAIGVVGADSAAILGVPLPAVLAAGLTNGNIGVFVSATNPP